jgi:hypothetical protein
MVLLDVLRAPPTGGRGTGYSADRDVLEGRSTDVVGLEGGGRGAAGQDIRHSDERMRQWSTARRLVNMVEIMGQA